ncbi:hypothetical protein BH09BAC1_BH09BAC1_27430 [soil metagenome]
MSAKKLRNEDIGVFLIDITMTLILIINLLWFAFDFLWLNRALRGYVELNIPGFYNFYAPVHEDFPQYDLYFVIVFLTEFLIRWTVSVGRGVYHRWFYYPIIHFYDVLGLIPVGGFRFLRILRLFSIVYRLQRMGIINVRKWYIYQQVMFVKDVFVEEISDRVIIRLLTGIQKGVEKESEPGTDSHMMYNAINPHRQEIINWITNKIHNTAASEYLPKREKIQQEIEEKVKALLEGSGPIQTLEKIPLVGKSIAKKMETSISEGIFEGIDNIMQKLADDNNTDIQEYAAKVFDALVNKKEGDAELNRIIKSIVSNLLEEMKKQTAVKEWQLKNKKTS